MWRSSPDSVCNCLSLVPPFSSPSWSFLRTCISWQSASMSHATLFAASLWEIRMDERIALSRRARSVFGGIGETALGERAPYFDRRKAIYQVGRFLLRLAPFGLFGCRFSRLASTFPWPCSLSCPLGFPFSWYSPAPVPLLLWHCVEK